MSITYFGVVFLAIAFLEIISRLLYLRLIKRRRLEHIAVDFIQNSQWNERVKFIPLPYSLYWNAPNYFINGIRQTNSQGYRSSSAEPYLKKPEGVFRILVLGSSTTYSDHFSIYPETAWTSHLERFLLSNTSKKFQVINAGLNYATSAELLCHFIFHSEDLDLDLVIVDGPGNDFLPVAAGDESGDYRNTRASFRLSTRRGEQILLKSGLVRLFYLYWVTTKHMIELEPKFFSLDSEDVNYRLLNSDTHRLSNNIGIIGAICESRKLPLVLIDFLRPSEVKLKNLFPHSWRGTKHFDNLASQAYAVLCKRYGAVHIKANEFGFPDEAFHDHCHLKVQYEKSKADKVGKMLISKFFSS